MAIAVCLEIPALENFSVRMPGYGVFEAIRTTLQKVPSNCDLGIDLLALIQSALAPLRPFIDVLELLLAIVNCIFAIKTAVTRLSPGPIVGCLRNLREALDKVLQHIPPIPWLRMIADILRLLIITVNCLLDLLADFDRQILRIQNMIARSSQLNDDNLSFIAECTEKKLRAVEINALHIMRTVSVLMTAVLVLLNVFQGGSEVEEIIQSQSEMQQQINDAISGATVFPSLQERADFLVTTRTALERAFKIVATPLGETLGVPLSAPPTFVSQQV